MHQQNHNLLLRTSAWPAKPGGIAHTNKSRLRGISTTMCRVNGRVRPACLDANEKLVGLLSRDMISVARTRSACLEKVVMVYVASSTRTFGLCKADSSVSSTRQCLLRKSRHAVEGGTGRTIWRAVLAIKLHIVTWASIS